MRYKQSKRFKLKRSMPVVAMASALAAMSAQGFEIDTGNDDVAVRWDNTVKLNLGRRMTAQANPLINSVNYNDGDRNFDKGDITSRRIDLLSELELTYKRDLGMRVSGIAWYDSVYKNLKNPNPTSNHLVDGSPAVGLSDYANRYYHGPSGEFLDAFAFKNFDFGAQSLNLKLGKTTQVWGEALLSPVHGLNYGQSPIDFGKLFSVPGTEAKELFMPRSQLHAQFTASPELSFGAQYFFDWKNSRLPEAGTYMGMYDLALDGAESVITAAGPSGIQRALKVGDLKPKKSGDFGLNAKWGPAWLDGTLGLFYRRTADTLLHTVLVTPSLLPMASVGAGCGALGTAAGPFCVLSKDPATVSSVTANALGKGIVGTYDFGYARNIDILGVTLSKNIAGSSFGADVNVRRNMPLVSLPAITVLPAPLAAVVPGAIAAPQDGSTGGAYGKTMHVVLNTLSILPKSAISDTGSILAELTWNRLLSVTRGNNVFIGNPAVYNGIDRATKDFVGIAFNFTPTWFQVYPGVDMSAPINYSRGLLGQSAVTLGGNKGAGSYSVGLSTLIHSRYTVDLKYSNFFGPYQVDPTTGQITSMAGPGALLVDRGTLALTFKATF